SSDTNCLNDEPGTPCVATTVLRHGAVPLDGPGARPLPGSHAGTALGAAMHGPAADAGNSLDTSCASIGAAQWAQIMTAWTCFP
ncbi:MAG: hypothetical protein ABI939_03745, partial [Anaerolineaceae bacterium]